MGFPTTETGLKEAGYIFDNAGKCRGCGAEIAWYAAPEGHSVALDEGDLSPHWKSCKNPSGYRDNANPKTGPFSTKTDGRRK